MKIFDSKEIEKFFVFLANSLKTEEARKNFSDRVKIAYDNKVQCEVELPTYFLTKKDVQDIYNDVKVNHI